METTPNLGNSQDDVADQFRRFNHQYNAQLCIMRCINTAGDVPAFMSNVAAFELTLLSEKDKKELKELHDLRETFNRTYGKGRMQADSTDGLQLRFELSRAIYRKLYGWTKARGIERAVLAIGRPTCHKCGEYIKWNEKERADARKEIKSQQEDGEDANA